MTSRREYLTTIGGIATLAIAGCTAPSQQSTPTPDDDHHHDDDGHHNDDGHHQQQEQSTDHTHENNHLEKRSNATVEMITQNGQHFSPHIVWIETGGTITWDTTSGGHTATSYNWADITFDSGYQEEDDDPYTQTINTEGVHFYYCKPHTSVGMVGAVIVGDPDPDTVTIHTDGLDDTEAQTLKTLQDRIKTQLEDTHTN